ncbi:MAG TPA: OmpA family protein [Terriglobales bacterium]|nr:OmpA family protein [Terriglobales bacterium]
MKSMQMFAAAVALTVPFTVGCATKQHVRQQTAPIIQKVNELDELTAKNTKDIRDVDSRAQQGIQSVQTAAEQANQKASAAGQQAGQAQELASTVAGRANQLAETVVNLDNYHPVVETSVHFGFDKWNLTKKAKETLDELGSKIGTTEHYLLVVDGNADATGPAEYNAILSKRRADAVIQYLVGTYKVPAYRIHVIGLGEDKPVEDNKSSDGRAKNRRVDVRLMTNTQQQAYNPQPEVASK